VRCFGVKLFNSLPKQIRNITSTDLTSFKSALDQFLKGVEDKPLLRSAANNGTHNNSNRPSTHRNREEGPGHTRLGGPTDATSQAKSPRWSFKQYLFCRLQQSAWGTGDGEPSRGGPRFFARINESIHSSSTEGESTGDTFRTSRMSE
jgi:hypothetical protein